MLEKETAPVITDYRLFQLVLGLMETKHVNGHDIDIRTKDISADAVRKRIYMLSQNDLKIDSDFKKNYRESNASFPRRVWKNPTKDKGNASEIACSVDPLCYVSHLSAMQIYGITERNPKDIIITIAGRKAWKKLTTELRISSFEKDDITVPLLHISLPNKLRNRTVHAFTTEHILHPAITQENGISRIVPIGRCFIDMLSEPWICGGILHVLDVFSQHGKVFKNEIIEAGEKDTRPIVKVRLGYVLDEYLGYEDPRIEKWTQFAQRGGSRKLDPKRPFDGSKISKKWMLSLNE